MDTSLTLKLQKRVTELEQEKQSLRNELENREEQFQRARARVGRPSLHPDVTCNLFSSASDELKKMISKSETRVEIHYRQTYFKCL